MMGHLNVPALDDSGLPSSLSPKTIKGIVREELKFDGLIISDALNMRALTKHYGDVDIVKRAYLAGNDILLYPSKRSEEHTSELQSRPHLVCRLLLEKKKQIKFILTVNLNLPHT